MHTHLMPQTLHSMNDEHASGSVSQQQPPEILQFPVRYCAALCCAVSCSHFLDDRQREYHTWLAAQCGPDVSTIPNWRAAVLHGYWLLRRLCVLIARFKRSAARGAKEK